MGLLPRRGFVVERAWVQVAREAVGPEGRVEPQQWLAHTTAPQVPADDRRRLDFVVYGATTDGEAIRRDETLVSPLILERKCGVRERRVAGLPSASSFFRWPDCATGTSVPSLSSILACLNEPVRGKCCCSQARPGRFALELAHEPVPATSG